jgi:hypothetical protein
MAGAKRKNAPRDGKGGNAEKITRNLEIEEGSGSARGRGRGNGEGKGKRGWDEVD